jgi:hypothetical protein
MWLEVKTSGNGCRKEKRDIWTFWTLLHFIERKTSPVKFSPKAGTRKLCYIKHSNTNLSKR